VLQSNIIFLWYLLF